MPKVAVAGGEIHYEEAGAGDPLIFVSGLGGTGSHWRAQIPVFSARFRVIIYDHRGTGASDRLQRAFSIDQMTAERGGGHANTATRPEAFNRIVLEFLR